MLTARGSNALIASGSTVLTARGSTLLTAGGSTVRTARESSVGAANADAQSCLHDRQSVLWIVAPREPGARTSCLTDRKLVVILDSMYTIGRNARTAR